jgi:cell division septum initiation protein DivIVA
VGNGERGTSPLGAISGGHDPFPFEPPPQRRHGYDVEVTDALLGQFSDRCDALAAECVALRDEVARLEAELAKRRDREQSVTNALIAAKQHADAIVADARRDAEEILSNAQAGAEQRDDLERLEREREEAQHEVDRLQRIQRDVHAGLTTFLLQAVELVQSDEEDQAPVLESFSDTTSWVDALEADFGPDGSR